MGSVYVFNSLTVYGFSLATLCLPHRIPEVCLSFVHHLAGKIPAVWPDQAKVVQTHFQF